MRTVAQYEYILLQEDILINRLRVGGEISKQELDRLHRCSFELLKALLRDATRPHHLVFQNLDQAKTIWLSIARKYPFLLNENGFENFLRGEMPDIYEPWKRRSSAELMRARHGHQPRNWSPRR